DRRALGGVGGDEAGAGGPVELAVVFVECEDAVLAAGVVAPAEGDAGDDDLIFVDRGRWRAAAEGGDQAELFGHLMTPDDVGIVAVEAKESALRAKGIDIARFRIAGGVGPADAPEGIVGLGHILA